MRGGGRRRRAVGEAVVGGESESEVKKEEEEAWQGRSRSGNIGIGRHVQSLGPGCVCGDESC